MKSVVILILLGLILGGCSKNNVSNKPQNDIVIELDAKSGLFTGTADFGSFPHNSTSVKLITFSLKNNGTESLAGPPTIDNPEKFSLAYTNCPAALLPTKSCSIKVTLYISSEFKF